MDFARSSACTCDCWIAAARAMYSAAVVFGCIRAVSPLGVLRGMKGILVVGWRRVCVGLFEVVCFLVEKLKIEAILNKCKS